MPTTPTAAEREEHCRNHMPFRGWCDACVAGRGQASPHLASKVPAESRYHLPQLQFDYWFMGGQGEAGREDLPVLVMYEKTREALFRHRAKAKGADMTVVRQVCEDLNSMGLKRAVYKTDQEASIMALMAAVKVQWKGELIPETAPRGDKDSNGSAESAMKSHENLTRTYKVALEGRIGRHIPDEAPIMEWLCEWAGTMHRRYRISERDGRTAFHR